MQQPIRFHSIDHLTLIVSDLERTRKFYCEKLGMQLGPRPEFDFPGLWLHPSEPEPGKPVKSMIHITLESDLAGLAGWGDREVKSLSRGHHFAFEVEDAKNACKYLQNLGVEIAVQPKQRPDGAVQFYVQDPDGHVIELFSKS
ncbi:MAG: VOC family protein [Planctomycetota bacterium]